jgi:hypothetical protein
MLSVSQEIYSQRVRLVVQNRGKLFESQYLACGVRLLVNIDRDIFCALGRCSEDALRLARASLAQVACAGLPATIAFCLSPQRLRLRRAFELSVVRSAERLHAAHRPPRKPLTSLTRHGQYLLQVEFLRFHSRLFGSTPQRFTCRAINCAQYSRVGCCTLAAQ